MKKTFFGLSKISVTICIGLPVIICFLAFVRTGDLNLGGALFLFLIMVGISRIVESIIVRMNKRKK